MGSETINCDISAFFFLRFSDRRIVTSSEAINRRCRVFAILFIAIVA